jgi:hypothetical protein
MILPHKHAGRDFTPGERALYVIPRAHLPPRHAIAAVNVREGLIGFQSPNTDLMRQFAHNASRNAVNNNVSSTAKHMLAIFRAALRAIVWLTAAPRIDVNAPFEMLTYRFKTLNQLHVYSVETTPTFTRELPSAEVSGKITHWQHVPVPACAFQQPIQGLQCTDPYR